MVDETATEDEVGSLYVYRVATADGVAWPEYSGLGDALTALKARYVWTSVYLAAEAVCGDEHYAWSAYATVDDMDADLSGAPRIAEVKVGVAS